MKTSRLSRFTLVALLVLLLVSGEIVSVAGEETAPASASGDTPALAFKPEASPAPAGPPPSPEISNPPTLKQMLASTQQKLAASQEQYPAPAAPAPAKTSKKKKAWIIVGVVVGAAAVAAAVGGGGGGGGGVY